MQKNYEKLQNRSDIGCSYPNRSITVRIRKCFFLWDLPLNHSAFVTNDRWQIDRQTTSRTKGLDG